MAQVIYIRMERIAWGAISVLRGRLITAAQRFIKHFSRAVVPREAKIDQVITGGMLRPAVSYHSAFEVLTPIHLRGVESLGVHFRGVKHDVVRCAVPEKVSESNSYL